MSSIKLLQPGRLLVCLFVVSLPLVASAQEPLVRTKPVIDHQIQVQAKHAHHHAAATHHHDAAPRHSATKATQLPPRS
jgi:hypothetical protein